MKKLLDIRCRILHNYFILYSLNMYNLVVEALHPYESVGV